MSDWRTEPRPHEVVRLIDVTPTLPAVIRRATQLFGRTDAVGKPKREAMEV